VTESGARSRCSRYVVVIAGEEHKVTIGPGGTVTVNGRECQASLAVTGGAANGTPAPARDGRDRPLGSSTARVSLLLDGASHGLLVRRNAPGVWELDLDARAVTAEVFDERAAAVRKLSGSARGTRLVPSLRAPMPGLVVRVTAAEGENVTAGSRLAIMEAMKMENELRAPADARVSRVLVAPGQAVERNQVLVEFEQPDVS